MREDLGFCEVGQIRKDDTELEFEGFMHLRLGISGRELEAAREVK